MKKTAGFTLVELLLVIAIIGILAAYLIPNVIAAQKKAYDAGAIACGKSLQVAEYLSQVDAQTYFVPSKVVTDTALTGLPPGIEVNSGCNGPDMVITNGIADQTWFAFLISDTRGKKNSSSAKRAPVTSWARASTSSPNGTTTCGAPTSCGTLTMTRCA